MSKSSREAEGFSWENPFTAEDFNLCKDELSQERMTQRAAHLANARFRELLKEHGEKVYGDETQWSVGPAVAADTHEAILVAKKEIVWPLGEK